MADKQYAEGSTSRKPERSVELDQVIKKKRPSTKIKGAQSPSPEGRSNMKLRGYNPDPEYTMYRI
jgi:hypothetical protein